MQRLNLGSETMQQMRLPSPDTDEGDPTPASPSSSRGLENCLENDILSTAGEEIVRFTEKQDRMLAIIIERYIDKPPRGFWTYQLRAAMLYSDIHMQVLVACLIVANFVTNMVEKQFDPKRDRYADTWDNIDYFYNTVFLLELLLNMYGFWFRPFWSSAWNWFDFLVVTIGVLNMVNVPLPGPLSLLRMMRAFRVFRLFKRVKSLNKIIVSLVRAIPGVLNAFLIMIIFNSIYAMLSVQFWQDVGFDSMGVCEDKFISPRGNCFGWEYFGNFFKAMYSLFQILTGESWSEAIVRLMLIEDDGVETNIGAGIFFLSFFLLNAVVLINVVVAVLLDKMANDAEEEAAAPAPDSSGQIVQQTGGKNGENQGEERAEDVDPVDGLCPDDGRITHSPDHLREDVNAIRGDLEEVMRRMAQFESSVQHCVGSLSGSLKQVLTKLEDAPMDKIKPSHGGEDLLKTNQALAL